MKKHFPETLFVNRDDSESEPCFLAFTSMFQASDEEGSETVIATYKLVKTERAKRVLSVLP